MQILGRGGRRWKQRDVQRRERERERERASISRALQTHISIHRGLHTPSCCSDTHMGFSILLRKFKGIKVKIYGIKAIKKKGRTQRVKAWTGILRGIKAIKKKGGTQRVKAWTGILHGIKAIKKKRGTQRLKAWTGISHGFHMVERGGDPEGSVLAQREQVEDMEVWLFGAFDQQMGPGITKYLQTLLFDNKLSKHQIKRKANGMMKKVYLSTRAKMDERENAKEINGFTAALVINGEEFVVAYFGGYKAVVCRDGVAKQIGRKHKMKEKGKWHIADMLRIKCALRQNHKSCNNLKFVVTSQEADSKTEFIILASDGIWEVMKPQEAVDLISHIEDSQEASECLAEEALIRMSKSTISCIVIRFN